MNNAATKEVGHMPKEGDPARSDRLHHISAAASRAGKANAWTNRIAEVTRKLGLGQQVDKVISVGAEGWQVTNVSPFRPEFVPKVGPLRGGGSVFQAKLPGGAEFVGRMNGSTSTNFVARISENGSTTFDKLGAAGKRMRIIGWALTAASSYTSQLARDAAQPDLNGDERQARATYRATTVTSADIAGGIGGTAGGAWLGGIIGTFFFPGPGTAVGATLGGLAGGYGGSKAASNAANAVVDRTVDSVGQGCVDELREDLSELVDDIADYYNEAAEHVAEFCREVASSLRRAWF